MGLLDAAVGAITGGASQKLIKLKIYVEGDSSDLPNPFASYTVIEAMYNPTSVSQTLTSSWSVSHPQPSGATAGKTPSPAPTQAATAQEWPMDTLTLDLFFDTTEPSAGDTSSAPGVVDVRKFTSAVTALTRAKAKQHRPPLCRLAWGDGYPSGTSFFEGYATQIVQLFTYFHCSGMPLRAKLSCSFKQWLDPPPQQNFQSTDVYKIHTVKGGETLGSIAKATLHDATLWRRIAVANGITDPLDFHGSLKPGRPLKIPTVQRR